MILFVSHTQQIGNKGDYIMVYDDDYNDKHNFTFRFSSNDTERHLEMNCNELYLYDIFTRFKEFLQGCGYEINGEIGVIDYDSSVEQPKFDFSNIPNNNWPFGAPASSNMNDTLSEQAETISVKMPGTIGAPTMSFR